MSEGKTAKNGKEPFSNGKEPLSSSVNMHTIEHSQAHGDAHTHTRTGGTLRTCTRHVVTYAESDTESDIASSKIPRHSKSAKSKSTERSLLTAGRRRGDGYRDLTGLRNPFSSIFSADESESEMLVADSTTYHRSVNSVPTYEEAEQEAADSDEDPENDEKCAICKRG